MVEDTYSGKNMMSLKIIVRKLVVKEQFIQVKIV